MTDAEVMRVVRDAAQAYPDDIAAAADQAFRAVRALSNYTDFADDLARAAVRDLVYDFRHAEDVKIRRESGCYGGAAKVLGTGDGVGRAYRSVYSYYIAGTTLGSLLGKELAAVAKGESARAEGHEFNARLCLALGDIVPGERTVRQAVPERKLKKLFRQVYEEVHGVPA